MAEDPEEGQPRATGEPQRVGAACMLLRGGSRQALEEVCPSIPLLSNLRPWHRSHASRGKPDEGPHQVFSLQAGRAVEDAASAVMRSMREHAVVPGAGALEAQCCHHLHHTVRSRDTSIAATERAAVEAFAAALLELPRVLLENGGCDSEGIIGKLMRAHQSGEVTIGVDVVAGDTMDGLECGVFEPLAGKLHAYRNATDTACGILSTGECITIPAPREPGKG